MGALRAVFLCRIAGEGRPFPRRKTLALELLSLVLNHPRLEGIDYHPAIFGKPALPTIAQAATLLEASLPAKEAAAARERGSHLVLEEVVSDLIAGRGRYWMS